MLGGRPLFINYFASPVRDSPLNASFARLIVGVLVFTWVAAHDFQAASIYEPAFLAPYMPLPRWLFPVGEGSILDYLWVLKIALLCAVFLFAIGYRTTTTGIVGMILVFYLGGISRSINSSDQFIFAFWLMIFLLLFRDEVRIGVDSWRQARAAPTADPDGAPGHFEMGFLRWMLVFTGMIYFLDAFAKLFGVADFAWLEPTTLRGFIQQNIERRFEVPPLAPLIIHSDAFALFCNVWTIGFEAGLLLAVLLRRSVGLWLVGLFIMHVGIFLTMNILYVLYFPTLYLLFVAWDNLAIRFASPDRLSLTVPHGLSPDQRAMIDQLRLCGLTDRVTVRSTEDEDDGAGGRSLIVPENGSTVEIARVAADMYPVNFAMLLALCPSVAVVLLRETWSGWCGGRLVGETRI
jgi:hypothetical protein